MISDADSKRAPNEISRRSLARSLALGSAALAAPNLAAAAAPDAIAESFAAALRTHDIDAFGALFADDYVNHQSSAAAPVPADGSAKALTVGFFAARLRGLPDLSVSIEASVANGDKVAASFVYEGTQTGPLMGVPPTGKKLRFTSCDIFRVQDGKIAEHWGMGDIAGILAQMKG